MIRTRFAPSPTGYMHIGNLRTALYTYLIAKKQNGKFILRIEDTDTERYVHGAIDIILDVLKDTGLNYDEGPNIGGDFGPYVQSERKHIYEKYAEKLVEQGNAYYCFCKDDRLSKLREEALKNNTVFKYDKHCLNLTKEKIKKKIENGEPYVIRQNNPIEGTTTFNDILYGEITVPNFELEDMILLKTDKMPTYNFANVIDDHLMNITHIVRGKEYLSSAPKYQRLYEAFSWEVPTYIHCPHIMKNETEKLSKRNGDASYNDLIEKGYLSEAIINYIALLGWSPDSNEEFFTLEELIKNFNYENISKSSSIFDIKKLKWMNSEYIKKMDKEKFHNMAYKYYENIPKQIDKHLLSEMLQNRIEIFTQIPDIIDFLIELPDYDLSIFEHKKMKTTIESSKKVLTEILPIFENTNDYSIENLNSLLNSYISENSYKNGFVLWPIRCALSGKISSPGGSSELAYLFQKDETLRRIKIAINKLN
ncbi:glutamate--tRNA ligase [Candidatus Arthromitus sp. SFB-turkey]|uniref:glutamate--tRNA ligase n=1 Tax=Candidatus Arthromitus sp. SFB-turkey TaxID=1840217 RepID=UPI0007F54B10|nr:glutamate--tRNA ligase [Candidatus Arthromitus sp. SFB-turkey]OAT88892.1 glutamate--tRNA ligase [Candidatus Arthromitus sp. SFB-turkey]